MFTKTVKEYFFVKYTYFPRAFIATLTIYQNLYRYTGHATPIAGQLNSFHLHPTMRVISQIYII